MRDEKCSDASPEESELIACRGGRVSAKDRVVERCEYGVKGLFEISGVNVTRISMALGRFARFGGIGILRISQDLRQGKEILVGIVARGDWERMERKKKKTFQFNYFFYEKEGEQEERQRI